MKENAMKKNGYLMLVPALLIALALVYVPAGARAEAAYVGTAETEGVRMDYAVFGDGERTFVILPGLSVHSVMGSAEAIAGAYQPFCERYTVYVFDTARDIREGYTVRDMANDTFAAMKSLGISGADIFGASQGGMIALYLAIDHPEMVNRLIIGSSLAEKNDTFTATVEKWKRLANDRDETGLLESFADSVYSQATLDMYRDYIIESNRGITPEEYERFLIQADACGSFDCTGELDRVKCPVLVLGSEGDRIVTADGSRRIAEALGCEIYLYDESYGHGVYDEAPDYKQRCLDFLTK